MAIQQKATTPVWIENWQIDRWTLGTIIRKVMSNVTRFCPTILRIDKGYQRSALNLARQFKTMIDVIIYYRYSERVYFSLFNDVYLIF